MAILRVDDFETETVGIGFLLSAESTHGQIGNANAETPAPFTESQRSEQNTQGDPPAKLANVIAISEVPELVTQHKRELILRADAIQQRRRNDNQSTGKRHRIGRFRCAHFETKFVR